MRLGHCTSRTVRNTFGTACDRSTSPSTSPLSRASEPWGVGGGGGRGVRGHRTFPLRPSKPSNSSDGLKKPPRSIPQDPVFKKKPNPVNSLIWNSNWILTSSVILFYWNVIHRHPDVLLLWSFSEWTQLLNVWTWIDATQFEVSVKKLLRIIGII